jgi:hypothetical protein
MAQLLHWMNCVRHKGLFRKKSPKIEYIGKKSPKIEYVGKKSPKIEYIGKNLQKIIIVTATVITIIIKRICDDIENAITIHHLTNKDEYEFCKNNIKIIKIIKKVNHKYNLRNTRGNLYNGYI